MKTQRKKKAFTLTELLVVVIVIGVLSAVVLPKFSKVIETRKTTEAEELMAAVRTEQEKRCALDKDYISDLSQLSEISPSKDTKNFVYSASTTGIEAQSKGKYGYTLKMPSYKDGRLCCENEAECLKLNKDYPLCSDLIARADYQTGAECAGEPLEIECSGSATRSCGCQNKGTQSRTCDKSTGTWGDWGACSISDDCECSEEEKPAVSQSCNTCGTQSRSVECDFTTGGWKTSSWGMCSVTDPCECTNSCETPSCDESSKPAQSESCNGCGFRKRSVTCNTSNWQWEVGAWGECSATEEDCNCKAGRTVVKDYWGDDTCDGDAEKKYGSGGMVSFTPLHKEECYDVYKQVIYTGESSSSSCATGATYCPPTQERRCISGVWRCVSTVNGENGYYNPSGGFVPVTVMHAIVVEKVVRCPAILSGPVLIQ